MVTKLVDLTSLSFSDLASLEVDPELLEDLQACLRKPGSAFLSGYNGSVSGEVDKNAGE